jgi:pimeloyl-ACP methyl ester carboxylesterase
MMPGVSAQAAGRSSEADAAQALASFRNNHPSRSLEIEGVSWSYRAGGAGGIPLLLLPGLQGVSEASFELMERFERTRRVIAPSYPAEAITMRALANGAAAILEAEGGLAAHVRGASFGGLVAQWLVRLVPQKVRSLLLSHTGAPNAAQAQANRRVLGMLRLMPAGWVSALMRTTSERALAPLAPERLEFWRAVNAELLHDFTKRAVLARYRAAIDFDRRSNFSPDDLRAWPGRILILEGDDDPLVEAPARAALRALYPQAQVHVFHGAGHAAAMADVPAYVHVIEKWLDESENRTRA